MAMNVAAKRSDNGRVSNALFELALVPSGNEGGMGSKLEFVLGVGVGKLPSIEKVVAVAPVVLATRVHSPVPSLPDTKLQYASNPSQVFVHLAVKQLASLSPSHSLKAAMLDEA